MKAGFFFKDVKTASGKKPRAKKQPPLRQLPPVLIIKVPEIVEKKKKEKKFTQAKPQLILDTECYPNYFIAKFYDETASVSHTLRMIDEFDVQPGRVRLRQLLEENEIVTFNGNRYDMIMLRYLLSHEKCTNKDLKELSNELILSEISTYKIEEKYNLPSLKKVDHIDLGQLTPMMASLKLCGGRLHCPKLQELPYPDDSILDSSQMNIVNQYCENDLYLTALLKSNLNEEIELRRTLSERYDIDLMSKSDAQIAEEIIRIEIYNRTGAKAKRTKNITATRFNYQIPEFISFSDPKLNEVLDILRENTFLAKPVNSGIEMPEKLKNLEIQIKNSVYRMGIGGLHSSEKTAFHLADEESDLWDFDVTSYYPSIILQCGLYPKNIGEVFLDIFKGIVDERIDAKEAGDKVKADSLKITVNGTFGKLGSPYSILYSPELFIQVTITGQLSLLMLIDMFEQKGFQVVSGNTDGIIAKCKHGNEAEMNKIVRRWENKTGFRMESTNYVGLYSRDVNNYIAIKRDGEVKTKGCFAYGKRQKNPEHDICTDAIIAYLKNSTPLEDTIKACEDIRKFITLRQVNGGAVKIGEHLGKVVRWYYSINETGTINYKTNGNKVPQTDGAKPIMELPDKIPSDINYDWYANKCKELFY